jgi:Aspartate/tyrosine/aromatic aminotransferase
MIIPTSSRLLQVEEYFFSKKLAEIDQLKHQGIEVINLGIGNPDLPPPPEMLISLSKASSIEHSNGYQSYKGIPELRKSFSNWYKHYFHVDLDPNTEVLPLLGSKEGIMHLSMAFLNQGDEVLIPNPGYPTYANATLLSGATPVSYLLEEATGYYPNFSLLENSDLSRVKMMWVNYPHMPTGTRSTPELMAQLIKFGRRHNILICSDNPYSFILNKNPTSILSLPGAKEVAVELNSLSKSHNMAGWRVGMLAGHESIIKGVLQFKSNMDSGMSLPVQLAAAAALNVKDDWYSKLNKQYSVRQRFATEMAKTLGCSTNANQSGMFVWAKIPDWIFSTETFCDEILKQTRVFLTPGTVFGSAGEGYLRISLCANEKTLTDALSRLQSFDIHR